MSGMLKLDPYLTLSEDACRRVVRSEWKDPSAFPSGYVFGNLEMTQAPMWDASVNEPTTVMTLGFIADPDSDFLVANVRTVKTFAFPSSVRKFESVATPADPEVLKIASHLPWIQPRFVMWSVKRSNGDSPIYLLDAWREDLIETEDFLWFVKECGETARVFFAQNRDVLGEHV